MATSVADHCTERGESAQDSEAGRPSAERSPRCWARWAMLAFGWLNVVLGILGVAIPGLPTTVFLIVAAWAFSKCSDRFHRWLWCHPTWGSSIRAWHRHRAIPARAKFMAVAAMSTSFLVVTLFAADGLVLPLTMASTMLPVAVYILNRPTLTGLTSNVGSG